VNTDAVSLTLEELRDFTLPYEAISRTEGLRTRTGSSPEEGDSLYWLGRQNNVVGRALVMRDSESMNMNIHALAWGGEGSGGYFEAFKALLRKSNGYARFNVTWRGGASTIYVVENGVIR
jgi:hypothetical protein